MSNLTIKKRLIITQAIIEAVIIICMIAGFVFTKLAVTSGNPDLYVRIHLILVISISAATLIGLTILIYRIIKSIKWPIESLSDASVKMAAGECDITFKRFNKDEFVTLYDQFDKMMEKNRENGKVIEAVANGDLTVEVIPKSDKDLIGNSLKSLVESNRSALLGIEEASDTVMTSASEVASASEALAQGSTEQASAIEEITASIDDVAGKTRNNAVEARNAAELMQDTFKEMELGNKRMEEMINAMEAINASSESISKIIKVIDDIAFQTNILALNAAVEAARAGEAGMGFAVVAEEVRNLAAKSSKAAAETSELIEESINRVKNGSIIADDTAKTFEKVSKLVSESETIVNGIADSSEYQATAMDQIDQAVGQISVVVQTNSATSEECAEAGNELMNQAERMREMIGRYNLGNAKPEKTTKSSKKKKSENADKYEQIISLDGGMGKY